MNIKNINIKRDYDELFIYLCKNGHLDEAKLLHQLNINPNIRSLTYSNALRAACNNGHLLIAKWLLIILISSNYTSSNYTSYGAILQSACNNGYLSVVQWLFEIKIELPNKMNLYSEYDNYMALWSACYNGHLSIVEWLLVKLPNSTKCIMSNNAEIFTFACKKGHLSVAQLLFEVMPNISNYISIYEERLFKEVCINGHLSLAQWLLEIKPTINISAYNDYIFTGNPQITFWTFTYRRHTNFAIEPIEQTFNGPIFDRTIIIDELKSDICSICCNNKCDIKTICDHSFCEDCLGTWYNKNKSCPICRFNLSNCKFHSIESVKSKENKYLKNVAN